MHYLSLFVLYICLCFTFVFQGEWTTFSNRKKKGQAADAISAVTIKSKPTSGNAKSEQKDTREGGGRSQSVEYHNRKS